MRDISAMRQRHPEEYPYEDLGFAKLDHHRNTHRFPEWCSARGKLLQSPNHQEMADQKTVLVQEPPMSNMMRS